MSDMTQTIVPKSDQLNSDDLIAGPRTIRITKVAVDMGGEQPASVYFEGDGGKPFKPCKSMRRVMVALWGADSAAYVGRSMTLYRDPKVTWGGMAVGGIRISHMSGIEEKTTLVLTETKKTRKPFVVSPLVASKAPAAEPRFPVLSPSGDLVSMRAGKWVEAITRAIANMESAEALGAYRAAMGPHLASMAEAGEHELVEQAERAFDLRRGALAEDMPA